MAEGGAAVTAATDVHGRGASDGRRLFEEWYAALTSAPERGEKAAYVFVMGSLVELLRCFDLHVVFPEINSLQTAVRKVADEYLNLAEDHGFSPDGSANRDRTSRITSSGVISRRQVKAPPQVGLRRQGEHASAW